MTPLLSSALLRAQSDDRLTALAAAGHDRAFEAIVERYRRPLLRHVRRFLPHERAEDVVQAAFVSAWGSLRSGTDVRELRPWLYRIATNGALNALKRAGADDAPLGSATPATGRAGDPGLEVERRDSVRRALTGLAELPERQREALVATALGGRPHAEVAAELGMTDGALRQLVHRARSHLRAVATALTPPPVLAAAATTHELTAARVAEVAAGAGGAGLAAAGLKLGAVAATAGVLVAGAPHIRELGRRAGPPPAVAAADRQPGAEAAAPAAEAPKASPPAAGSAEAATHRRHAPAAVTGDRRQASRRRRRTAAPSGVAGSPAQRSDDDRSSHDESRSDDHGRQPGDGEHRGSQGHGSDDLPEGGGGSSQHGSGSGSGDDTPEPPDDTPDTESTSSGSGSGSGSGDSAARPSDDSEPDGTPTTETTPAAGPIPGDD